MNGGTAVLVKRSPRAAEHRLDRVDLAPRRLRREACGEVDDVAHHRVGPPVGRPDLAGEDVAARDAGTHREARARVDDVAHREQHPLLVVADRPRRAGAEEELPAVGGDVRSEDADLVAIGRLLGSAHDLLDRCGGSLRALGLDQAVELAELQERDRRGAMLGMGGRGEQVSAQRRREAAARPAHRRASSQRP